MKTSRICTVLLGLALLPVFAACTDSDDGIEDPDDETEFEPEIDVPTAMELDAMVELAPLTARCATETDEADAAEADADDAKPIPDPPGPSIITIPVDFHVIRARINGHLRGNLSRDRIDHQIRVLNNAYGDTRFRFTLNKITRTTNANWFRMRLHSDEEFAAKRALHAGGKRTLNLYSTGTPSALGWSTPPGAAGEDRDGVVVHFATTPNDSGGRYSLGDTATHEIGHWLGLFHTFGNKKNGCLHGDGVSDTNAEQVPAFGCPTGRDTCAAAGDDPIHNFMDYSDDSCMFHFTLGQRVRMINKWNKLRD